MNTAQLQEDIAIARNAILDAVASIKQDDFNTIPFEGSWTAGQVTDHINKATKDLQQLSSMPVTTTERQPDAHVPKLKDIFLDMNAKYRSPDFILPSDGPHDKEALLKNITHTWDAVAKAATGMDLSPTATGFELPGVGQLTLWENIYLGIYHTQRHAAQLRKINKALAEKQTGIQ